MDKENKSATRNPYKVRAFASAIKVINQLDNPIRSAAEAKTVSRYIFFRFFACQD
jgi:hypothetical protein